MKIKNKTHNFLFDQIQKGDLIIFSRFDNKFVFILKIDSNKEYFIFYPKNNDSDQNMFFNNGRCVLNNSYLILR